MREKDEIGLGGFDDLLESDAVAVGRIVFEQIIFDQQNFGDVLGRKIVGESGDAFANDERGDGAVRVFRDVLGGGERFEAGVVPSVLALFGDDESFHLSLIATAKKNRRQDAGATRSPALRTSISRQALRQLLSVCR